MGFNSLSPWHVLIVVAVFVLLFGARKLPDAARSLGKSMRILKAETKALHDDDTGDDVRAPAPGHEPPRSLAGPGKPDNLSQRGVGAAADRRRARGSGPIPALGRQPRCG
jgi:sec-independent protein translocase protein TatA